MIAHDPLYPIGSVKMMLELIDKKIIEPQSADFKQTLNGLIITNDEGFYLLENLLYWSRIKI